MRQYIEIGSVPYDEPCAQVGRDSDAQMRAECRAFANQLRRMFPCGDFRVRRFAHDFGCYYEVVAYYDPDDRSERGVAQQQAAYAAECADEAGAPSRWDSQALVELSKGLLAAQG